MTGLSAWHRIARHRPRPSQVNALPAPLCCRVPGFSPLTTKSLRDRCVNITTAAVETLARRLSIPQWIAEALPQDKATRIRALSDDGAKVLMVGDGLNDTAALAAAHVSISPASALDAARVASDIVLLGNALAPLPEAIATARRATKRIRENFGIATWYNVIAVPLAIAGLCSPLIAALAMSASSITVSLNALRLR